MQLLRSQDVKHALMETFHMAGQLSAEVVAEIEHINGKLTIEQRWEVREFIDRVLKFGKATLTSPQTLITPEQQITVVYDGIWYFTLEPLIDRAQQDMAEADELVVLTRVAAFVARKTEAQTELIESQSTMRAMVEWIYAGVPTHTMGGNVAHPLQRSS
jgi:hypothetical protein